MFQSFKKILNSALHAQDGKIGHLDDLLFDDEKWIVRYLVVKTGGLLNHERVLISPLGIATLDWPNQAVKLNLTRKKIEASPKVDTELPVFRQMEKSYFDYNGWPYYWDDVGIWGIDPSNFITAGGQSSAQPGDSRGKIDGADPHLRSCRIVDHYSIEAEGTRFGHVIDFLIDDTTWEIKFLLVDSRTWWPSRPVMIDPKWVHSVDWFVKCIKVRKSKKEIESSPEFKSEEFIGRP